MREMKILEEMKKLEEWLTELDARILKLEERARESEMKFLRRRRRR